MTEITKQSILLTGGLGLLGRAFAKFLGEKGHHVIVVDIQEDRSCLPPEIDYIHFDLMKVDDYPWLREEVGKRTGNLKGLINNAAFNPKIEEGSESFGKFEDINMESWDCEIKLNLTVPVFLIKEMLPVFNRKDGKNCKLINVLSTYGLVPPNQDIYKPLSESCNMEIYKPMSYAVSKAALGMVTRYLSVYLGSEGFNSNGIVPGGIENGQPGVFVESYSRLTPMKRMACVDDMLGTLLLLCGEGSDYMNGQLIAVDGGWTVW